MATPHPGLYRKGRYWYYLISANGQRAHGSTRATDLATARRVLEEKRKELVDGLLKRPTRFKPVQDLIQEWLRVNRSIFSQGHYKSAESALRNWVVPVIGTMPINRVSIAPVMDLRVRMLEAECSGTYVNNTIKTLTAMDNSQLHRLTGGRSVPPTAGSHTWNRYGDGLRCDRLEELSTAFRGGDSERQAAS